MSGSTEPDKPKPLISHNSLHDKFNDPGFMSGGDHSEPNRFPSAQQDKPDSAGGSAPFNVGNFFSFGGHSIKTPHDHPISHPELALSPTDIGIWTERNTFHQNQQQQKGGQGK